MKLKIALRISAAILIAMIGYGGLLLHDLYIKPYVLADSVVVVNGTYPKYHEIRNNDVSIKKVAKEHIPAAAIRDINQVVGKRLVLESSENQILTENMVDLFHLMPGPDEGIFPIPRDAIYAVNGSLRPLDRVDIYLIGTEEKNQINALPSFSIDHGQTKVEGEGYSNDESAVHDLDKIDSSSPPVEEPKIFIEGATVVHARSDDNNDVMDAESGNTNERKTSTGRVTTPEILLSKEDGLRLRDKLNQGYQLWIVRIE